MALIIRSKSFESWMQSNFSKTELRDIAQYGADAGWTHLTYYTDTCKIYEKFKEEIWEALLEDADDFGQNVFEMIGGFGGASSVGSVESFENLLTWYMAERTARRLTE
jgi:hypothetical protein